ncbi:putative bifunctional diguanylate cyclase/phosphodiesterase [Sphingosinicella rhizophila]|uniref:EAL domain-containing protein n=1 Tax=Sphingosinicella rhizophila TaxID=3050082 RepID=A0ABU3Q5J0_9SPHN|nr:EAL domain-containing protein [Sphingosinicella sp. GR2756]MDT9598562.1 EAL domain-containing protein [Sphingosinicella sp. GR2756]
MQTNVANKNGRAKRIRRASLIKAELVAASVTIAAILLFAVMGSAVLPESLRAIAGAGRGADPILVTALLLNIALILFGWRRSRDLKEQVAARADAEEQAHSLAYRDYTTGLHNRRFLVTLAAKAYRRTEGAAALLVIDLDHFKKVNDLHGHATGDRLLNIVASIIQASVPDNSCCARLGGDEFAVLLLDATPADADLVAEQILASFSEPVEMDGRLVHVGASLGISYGGGRILDVEALLRRGDIAMYEAKRRGRNHAVIFDRQMEEELRQRSELEADMRVGIRTGQFMPYYQPQIDLLSGKLHGLEVLARWVHPTKGLLEPTEFIPIAEASGLISDLSLDVMRQALAEAKDWESELMLAVNVSPVQLKDPLLAQRVIKVLIETGFAPQRLELEITESSLFDNLDLALTTIESLKNYGITVSLDDFGTGYSSLTQLQALPFDRIKIDRSFVTSMVDNDESAAIVSSILNLGASLGLPVTAEGIETPAIKHALSILGCAQGQGWLIGRPVPAAGLKDFLNRAGPAAQPLHAGEAAADAPRERRARKRGPSTDHQVA